MAGPGSGGVGGNLCRRSLTGEAIHDLGKPRGTQHLGVLQCPGCGHAHLPHAVTCGPQQQGRLGAAVTRGPGRPQTPVSWLFTPSPPARDRWFPSTRLRSSRRSQAVPQTQGRPSSCQAAFNSQMPGIRSPAPHGRGPPQQRSTRCFGEPAGGVDLLPHLGAPDPAGQATTAPRGLGSALGSTMGRTTAQRRLSKAVFNCKIQTEARQRLHTETSRTNIHLRIPRRLSNTENGGVLAPTPTYEMA